MTAENQKIKKYLEYRMKLKKLESELNFAYVIRREDCDGQALMQAQMSFLWNLGYALVDPDSPIPNVNGEKAIRYAAPEKISEEKHDDNVQKLYKIEKDFMAGDFESLDPYLN